MRPPQQQRVDWLLQHPDLWAEWSEDAPDAVLRPVKRRLVEAMKRDGVLAASTYWVDVQMGKLVAEARRRQALRKCPACRARELRVELSLSTMPQGVQQTETRVCGACGYRKRTDRDL
jgi:hypothetical protein